MEKINVEIKNCYGINSLANVFDFTQGKSTQIIYAANGIMKTSFSNVLDDYSKDIVSSDLIHPDKVSERKITDQNGDDIPSESIFVIRPYETFKSKMMSTLLVNESLRKEYEEIHEKINEEKDKIIKLLSSASGLKKKVEDELITVFSDGTFLEILCALESIILDESESMYGNINYSKIFDDKVVAFLETGNIKDQIKNYIEKYDELINKSPFLKRDFNHYNASTVHKNLKDHGFFKADHTINLNINGVKKEIIGEKEFRQLIQGEKEKILNDNTLQTIFEDIDKKISNAQLRDFREYLFENKQILTELIDLKNFKKQLWISYLKDNQDVYKVLLNEYKQGQNNIKRIIEKAKNQETEWENVIKIFNRRFFVPYSLGITNKEDSILKDEAPSIKYFFKNRSENVDESLLLRVLSQGERRTFYLLNIIFEIESRKKRGIKTLFIIDDIADSFDYKNKYAIVEYLKEISEEENFFSIILTHNFDFFRTIQDRINGVKYSGSYMAIKDKEFIKLENLPYRYISNPFKDWKNNLNNNAKLIASVTFARNIAEYTGDNENFNKLTSILHIKENSSSITINDIQIIYSNIFKDLREDSFGNPSKKIFDLIFEVADEIVNSELEIGLNLENKIVLSIAIRLNAEFHMINKINDREFVLGIRKNQTGKLFDKFKKTFTEDLKGIEVLEKVNLMTPENIHLNSFMFEPILDISDHHLRNLYNEVNQLIIENELEQAQREVAAEER